MSITFPQEHADRSDGELLQRYLDSRDDLALTELITRHAALVRGVCRRVLGSTADADDAFQATFLVLVRSGGGIRRPRSLAAWLYGVAQRIALRQRKHLARPVVPLAETSAMVTSDPLADLATQHEIALFDAELARLPEKYRAPIVLHHLEGKTQREVAAELQLTEGAVNGLLKRGRNELRLRLAKRGVVFGVTLAALQAAQSAVAAAPADSLISATVHGILAHDPILHPEYPKTPASQLARQEIMTMGFVQITKAITCTGLAIALIGVTNWGVSYGQHTASQLPVAAIASTLAIAEADATPAAEVAGPPVVSANELPSENDNESKTQRNHPKDKNGFADFSGTPLKTADAPTPIHYKKLNPTEARIESALKDSTEVTFDETSLRDACDYIEDLHGLEILINTKELEGSGISPDVQISLEVSGVLLGNALDLMLEPLGLDYVIKNEVMMITSQRWACEEPKYRELRIYDPEPFVAILGTVPPDDKLAVEKLTNLIKSSLGLIDEDDFGSIELTKAGLIVRANQRLHRELENFVDQLRQAQQGK